MQIIFGWGLRVADHSYLDIVIRHLLVHLNPPAIFLVIETTFLAIEIRQEFFVPY